MLKGLEPTTAMTGLVMTILVTALIATFTITADGEVIRPGVNNITDKFNEYQTPTVQIGDDGVNQEDTKKEFRGLVTYNMLTAANCNLVPLTTNGIENSGSGTDVKYFGGFEDAVNGLDYEFTGNCVREIAKIPDLSQALNPFNDDTEESSDLEGRQGKVKFNVSQTFTINEEQLMRADFDSSLGEGFLFNSAPGFWNNKRIAAFVPDGIRGDVKNVEETLYLDKEAPANEFTTDWIDNDGSAPPYSELYYYRVRMTGVPTIIDNDNFRDYDNQESFRTFVKDARYQFCEGAEGTIQSNAKYIDFGGEAQGDKSAKENAVYPEVQITEGSRSCLADDIHESDYNGRDFIDYSITGEDCTYEDLGDGYTVSDTGVEYQCMLMEESVDFPDYDGDVNFLKTGWKANQSTCELELDDISDEVPSSLTHPADGDSVNKMTQSLNEYSSPFSLTAKVNLSHPSENTYPGKLSMDMPNDIQKSIVKINMNNPLVPPADKRVGINILNTDSILNSDVSIDDYDTINIDSDRNYHEFNLTYADKTLTVKHIDTGRSISTELQPDEPDKRNLIEGSPEEFSLEVEDKGLGENSDSQEMNLDIKETIIEAYPKGCVPEAMNE